MRWLVLGVEKLAFPPFIAAPVTELVGFVSLRDRLSLLKTLAI
jgi:hypothetical protein